MLLIPLFAWSRTGDLPALTRRATQGLCWALLVPRGALRLASRTLPEGLLSADAYRVAELSFRSWILLLLLPLVLLAVRDRLRADVTATGN